MAGFGFNTKDYANSESTYAPLPAGEYKMRIDGSEMKISSSSGNEYLSFEFTVAEGQFMGRKLWSNFNIFHPKENVQQIAREQLAALCDACGSPGANDSSELHGRVVQCKVKLDENSDFPNSIKSFRKVGNSQTAQPGPAAPAHSSAASRSSGKPWERAAS